MRWAREVGCYQEDIRFGSLREVVDGELQCNDLGRLYGLRTTFKQSSCLFKNISKPWGFLWISVGFLGQAMFTFRMVLQWWASEKHKRSVVPVGFWWGSLIGGAMLFAYFIWRKDIVGIVGQSTGVFVYARNLVLIYRGGHNASASEPPLGESKPNAATT